MLNSLFHMVYCKDDKKIRLCVANNDLVVMFFFAVGGQSFTGLIVCVLSGQKTTSEQVLGTVTERRLKMSHAKKFCILLF